MVMNNQYLEGIVLSVLNEHLKGIYPYEIRTLLGDKLQLSDSTVYSICNRLVKKEYVRVDDKIHVVNGRSRKYYHITNKGMDKLKLLKSTYQTEKMVMDRWLAKRADE